MLKASALYIVIIIALVIGLICSSLIVSAYFYRMEYQKKFRYDQLENNVCSGVNILLASEDTSYAKARIFSLFGSDADSVSLQRFPWGVYDVGISKAFIQKDTIVKVFSFANAVDSSKWAALYLEDQDRPLSLSGETSIVGNAFIPKAGVKKAYVNNKAYVGDERLVAGKKDTSQKKLPQLKKDRLLMLDGYLSKKPVNAVTDSLLKTDSIQNSFLTAARFINFGRKVQTIKNATLRGNIILFSDTTLIIDNSAVLDNVLVFAKSIIVKSTFHGTCQLFARDSIHVEPNCIFDYPSCLGVLKVTSDKRDTPIKIEISEKTIFNGLIFTYQLKEDGILPLISIGKDVKIYGQIYSQGMIKYKDDLEVNGSVFTSLFVYQSSFNLMENMLIDSKLNSRALSPYYLTSDLMSVAGKNKKILQWLEKN